MTAAGPPSRDRITQVRFSDLRTAANVVLDCGPMTVLIGANGVGKSSLIEGLEILRKLESSNDFIRALNDEHGGISRLLRHGASELKLGVDITDGSSSMTYQIILARQNGGVVIEYESLHDGGEMLLMRSGDSLVLGTALDRRSEPSPISVKTSALAALSVLNTRVGRMTKALMGIEIHVPFATQSRWWGPGMVPERNMRGDNTIQSTELLDRGGVNLANVVHELRNRPDWADTLDTIRLVIDDDITDVTTRASASGGSIGLAVSYRNTGPVPAFALSDGTLALLALISITRLDGGDAPRSLLVLDEPDLHLHPGAIGQIMALLEECSAKHPVLIATHSDRLLDSLSEPASATVLCELDERRCLRLRRPDRAQLDRWLAEYRGIGHVRAEGYEGLVFPKPKTAETA